MTVTTVIAIIFMLGGAFFLTVSCVGLIRLPDFYNRNHAVGKSETLGIILMLLGLIIYNGWALTSFKLLIILLFTGIANPTATHAVLLAAFWSGLQPWTRKGKPDGKSNGGDNIPPQRVQNAEEQKGESEVKNLDIAD
ncbi:MAG: hypothetical protein A2144_04075 [Chloroflexi bacterium RBG_16_50_9]|nr:MAG: hypothetical protein A2144_04075 [Chloroflexi bacterium RBG_16_50_9]